MKKNIKNKTCSECQYFDAKHFKDEINRRLKNGACSGFKTLLITFAEAQACHRFQEKGREK